MWRSCLRAECRRRTRERAWRPRRFTRAERRSRRYLVKTPACELQAHTRSKSLAGEHREYGDTGGNDWLGHASRGHRCRSRPRPNPRTTGRAARRHVHATSRHQKVRKIVPICPVSPARERHLRDIATANNWTRKSPANEGNAGLSMSEKKNKVRDLPVSRHLGC